MLNMGEIDTKPIDPVQVALTLFEEKGDQRKLRPCSSSSEEMGKEQDVEGLLKDLANCKVQLEAKDSSYLQLVVKVEYCQKKIEELSALIKNCEVERDFYKKECREAPLRINELQSKVTEMADQLLETGKIREQLSHALGELKVTQGELLSMETELAEATEAKLKALTQVELLETAAYMEKERAEELLKHVSDLNEAILLSKLDAIEAEKEKCMVLLEKDSQIELATETAAHAQEQLEDMRRQLEMMQELENQLLAKSIIIDSLQTELNLANELLNSSNREVSDDMHGSNDSKADLRGKEIEIAGQEVYIGTLESELNQLKLELKNSNDVVTHLHSNLERLKFELRMLKTEVDETKERENEALVEIALLKSELHKGRSELAAAKAAEARAGNVKSGLYLAVQKLAVEVEEVKKENQKLKKGEDNPTKESDYSGLVDRQYENSSRGIEISQENESKAEAEESKDEDNDNITIWLEEYKSLTMKAEKANQSLSTDSGQVTTDENKKETEILKKELEVALAKIGEFRTRSEQAVSRAEAAEKAKLMLEAQISRWRNRKEKRKAALAALREESSSWEFIPPTSYDTTPRNYQPLGKVLNMKF